METSTMGRVLVTALSVPLTWDELTARITSDRFNVRNVGKRLASLKRDPWPEIFTMRQTFAPALRKLRRS
jgi:bifunctional non-homologous end joining protein LigD